MTASQLASKLAVWSKRKITYAQGLIHAQNYLSGALGEGIIKEFFKEVYPEGEIKNICRIPTCNNTTSTTYCQECTDMIPGSAVVGLLKDLGDFLCGRQSGS